MSAETNVGLSENLLQDILRVYKDLQKTIILNCTLPFTCMFGRPSHVSFVSKHSNQRV